METVTIRTTIVRFVASRRVGQLTLRSSPIVSLIKRRMAFGCRREPFLSRLDLVFVLDFVFSVSFFFATNNSLRM